MLDGFEVPVADSDEVELKCEDIELDNPDIDEIVVSFVYLADVTEQTAPRTKYFKATI